MTDSQALTKQQEETPIQSYVLTAASVEKARVAVSNRLSALQRGADAVERPVPSVYQEVYQELERLEDRFDPYIAEVVAQEPVWDYWLGHIRGVDTKLAGLILAGLLPVQEGFHVGSWYKAAGLIPQEHNGEKRIPRARAGGPKLTHCRYLRRNLWILGDCLRKQGNFYKSFYEETKAKLAQKHTGEKSWDANDGQRCRQVALWITVKLFLSHLWDAQCAVKGLPKPVPYAFHILGHEGYIPRPEWTGNGKV